MTRDREVSQATDLRGLVESYGVKLRRINATVAIGRCPFHNERTASFRVNLAGHTHAGKWWCFGQCGSGGDAIDFVLRIEGVSHFDALKILAAQAGIPLDGPAETPRQRETRRSERASALRWFRFRWKYWRGALNAEMRNGPPEFDSVEYRRAELCGAMMRLCQVYAGTDAGLRVYREVVGR